MASILNMGLSIEEAKRLVRDLEWYIQQAENGRDEWEQGIKEGRINRKLDSPIYIRYDPWPESLSGNAGIYTVTRKGCFPGDGVLVVDNKLENFKDVPEDVEYSSPLY